MACIQERLLIKSGLWWRAYGIWIFPKKSKKNFTGLWLQISDSNGHPIHLTNQDSMHMSHMKRDRFLSYWLCDTWTLKIKKEHDMHNQTSGIHQKWGFNSQQSKGKGQMLPFASKLVNDICILFIKCQAIWYSDWNPIKMTVQLCNLDYRAVHLEY